MYINCHSHFSFKYGTLSIEELIALARVQGVKALALTDVHSMAGCYQFARQCRAEGIKPVVGMEFRRGQKLMYVALAKNMAGFAEINAFCSEHLHTKKAFPELPPSAWENVIIIYPWARREGLSLGENEYLGIKPSEVLQVYASPYRQRLGKLLIRQPVTYKNKSGYNLHRLLRAVDLNLLLSQLPEDAQAGTDETFASPAFLQQAFSEFPQIIQNTEAILDACSFDFEFGTNITKQVYSAGRYEDMVLLEKLAREGLARRYGPHNQAAQQRIERELRIINQLEFNAYFLITWDFVRYGQHRGFFHVGRGSGANSLVAYCLGITDVDPLALDLYFERFLNPKRSSPPDFDIDYSWRDRDEVIDYVLKRYGHRHTALLATWNRFKARSALRELGKVFGLPKTEIDRLIKNPNARPEEFDELTQLAVRYAHRLQGVPNHLSIHAGGILISDAPIHHYSTTELPPKGFPITQFDMYEAEEIGLHKFDVLSQRGLGHIRDSIDLVKKRHEREPDIHDAAKLDADPAIKRLLATGRTLGCFYVESPAMRGLLQKLQCDNYRTLVAASSVIRPGVARSGMMQEFISRHNGSHFQYLHETFSQHLGETYGVMVYQEDVLKIAHYFAGLSLADGDLLRRAMSGKFRDQSQFKKLEARFFGNCRARGHSEELAHEVWRQIESFAGYSFCKAHSASFAVESLQSLYLKAYYPLEFFVAVANNYGGFYDAEIYLNEARRHGGNIALPCVNHSVQEVSLHGERDIYIGFVHIKGLQKALVASMLRARSDGAFEDLNDFLKRVPISIEQLTLLIRVGAFRFTGQSKANLLWEAHLRKPRFAKADAPVLFDTRPRDMVLPDFPSNELEDMYDEMEILGFPLRPPFEHLVQYPEGTLQGGFQPAHLGKTAQVVAYLVTRKMVRTVHGDLMQFANFIDPVATWIDVTIFPPETEKYPLSGRAAYLITGKVVEEFGVYSMEATEIERLALKPDPRLADHTPQASQHEIEPPEPHSSSQHSQPSGGRGAPT
ncbi:MAG: DNA polymerase III subunit alpha [Bacteroidia bacterium]